MMRTVPGALKEKNVDTDIGRIIDVGTRNNSHCGRSGSPVSRRGSRRYVNRRGRWRRI
jgi:hypothetical protein